MSRTFEIIWSILSQIHSLINYVQEDVLPNIRCFLFPIISLQLLSFPTLLATGSPSLSLWVTSPHSNYAYLYVCFTTYYSSTMHARYTYFNRILKYYVSLWSLYIYRFQALLFLFFIIYIKIYQRVNILA